MEDIRQYGYKRICKNRWCKARYKPQRWDRGNCPKCTQQFLRSNNKE